MHPIYSIVITYVLLIQAVGLLGGEDLSSPHPGSMCQMGESKVSFSPMVPGKTGIFVLSMQVSTSFCMFLTLGIYIYHYIELKYTIF